MSNVGWQANPASGGRIQYWDGAEWQESGPEDSALLGFRQMRCRCRPNVVQAWGTTTHPALGLICEYCQLPTTESLAKDLPGSDSRAEAARTSMVVVSTTADVPGFQVAEILGLVSGAGNVAFKLGSANIANAALQKAAQDLQMSARLLGADAVIGVTSSMTGGGSEFNKSQTVSLLGTAVRLRKIDQQSS